MASGAPVTAQSPATRLADPIFVQSAGIPGLPAAKVKLIADAGFNGMMSEAADNLIPDQLSALEQRNQVLVGIWRNAQSDIAAVAKACLAPVTPRLR